MRNARPLVNITMPASPRIPRPLQSGTRIERKPFGTRIRAML